MRCSFLIGLVFLCIGCQTPVYQEKEIVVRVKPPALKPVITPRTIHTEQPPKTTLTRESEETTKLDEVFISAKLIKTRELLGESRLPADKIAELDNRLEAVDRLRSEQKFDVANEVMTDVQAEIEELRKSGETKSE